MLLLQFVMLLLQSVESVPDETYLFSLVILRLHSRRGASIAAWRHACECRSASMDYQRKPADYHTAGAHKALRRSP